MRISPHFIGDQAWKVPPGQYRRVRQVENIQPALRTGIEQEVTVAVAREVSVVCLLGRHTRQP